MNQIEVVSIASESENDGGTDDEEIQVVDARRHEPSGDEEIVELSHTVRPRQVFPPFRSQTTTTSTSTTTTTTTTGTGTGTGADAQSEVVVTQVRPNATGLTSTFNPIELLYALQGPSSTGDPGRTVFYAPRSSASAHALRRALVTHAELHDAVRRHRHSDVLNAVLLRSADEFYNSESTSQSQSPPVDTLPIPTTVRDGCTRTVDRDNSYVCAWCKVTLNEGIPSRPTVRNSPSTNDNEENKENELEKWEMQYRGTGELDWVLSKRVYFSSCAHVYCGWCVKRIRDHYKRVKKQPRKREKLDLSFANNNFISKCAVSDCKGRMSSKFTEIYC